MDSCACINTHIGHTQASANSETRKLADDEFELALDEIIYIIHIYIHTHSLTHTYTGCSQRWNKKISRRRVWASVRRDHIYIYIYIYIYTHTHTHTYTGCSQRWNKKISRRRVWASVRRDHESLAKRRMDFGTVAGHVSRIEKHTYVAGRSDGKMSFMCVCVYVYVYIYIYIYIYIYMIYKSIF